MHDEEASSPRLASPPLKNLSNQNWIDVEGELLDN
jgi:hypothetical protein